MWSIPPPTLDVAARTHNVTSVKHSTDFAATLEETLRAYPDALVHLLPHSSLKGAALPLFPILPQGFRDVITTVLGNVAAESKVTNEFLLSALHQARLTKDAYEVAQIRKANEISSRAHETVMRVLGLGIKNLQEGKSIKVQGRPLLPSEWLIEQESEAEALFVASCRREGYVSLIVLHFRRNLTFSD
jgi:Xaa-Pro dipeptidase